MMRSRAGLSLFAGLLAAATAAYAQSNFARARNSSRYFIPESVHLHNVACPFG